MGLRAFGVVTTPQGCRGRLLGRRTQAARSAFGLIAWVAGVGGVGGRRDGLFRFRSFVCVLLVHMFLKSVRNAEIP